MAVHGTAWECTEHMAIFMNLGCHWFFSSDWSVSTSSIDWCPVCMYVHCLAESLWCPCVYLVLFPFLHAGPVHLYPVHLPHKVLQETHQDDLRPVNVTWLSKLCGWFKVIATFILLLLWQMILILWTSFVDLCCKCECVIFKNNQLRTLEPPLIN